eukprot:2328162-Amphidinium_carterae.1
MRPSAPLNDTGESMSTFSRLGGQWWLLKELMSTAISIAFTYESVAAKLNNEAEFERSASSTDAVHGTGGSDTGGEQQWSTSQEGKGQVIRQEGFLPPWVS